MLLNNNIFINNKAYDWGSILVVIEGYPVIGISNISYSETMNHQNIYGTGLYPVHTGFGKVVPQASITLNADEIFTLQNVAVNGILQNLPPFDIMVTYNYAEELSNLDFSSIIKDPTTLTDVKPAKTIILKNCRFTNVGFDVSQNDMNIEYRFNLSLSHIIWKPITQEDFKKLGNAIVNLFQSTKNALFGAQI